MPIAASPPPLPPSPPLQPPPRPSPRAARATPAPRPRLLGGLSSLRLSRAPGLAAAVLALSLLAGCAGVTVSSMAPREYLAQRRADILTTGRLSPAAQEVLRVIGTEPRGCEADGPACRQAIEQSSGLTDEQRLSALAEIWLQTALATGSDQSDTAIETWLETARHAYAYLFFTPRAPGERAFEDRQTQVRDYYNFAVQQASTRLFQSYQRGQADGDANVHADTGAPAATQAPRADTASDFTLPQIAGWTLSLEANDMHMPSVATPSQLIPASSLAFTGLRNTYRRDGFGAELVAVFDESDLPAAREQAYQEMPYPALTVLLRFEGRTQREVLATRQVRVQLLDPYRSASLTLAGVDVPVAANFTAGYGLWLARSDFARQALRTLLGLSNGLKRPTVYLMQPYDPRRRVIVMLHGLASSPEAWINVANEVLGDEQLRRRYQIWQVYYPTNAPIPLNNRAIRQALEATFAYVDPAGAAPASRQVTLIGHSMGGVLARLLVSSSDRSMAQTILDGYDIVPGRRAELLEQFEPYLAFSPLPQAGSAIFIAAPHRGTPFARNRLSRWAANLVTLPAAMLGEISDVARAIAQASPRSPNGDTLRIPNSIDNLSDHDPFVRLAAQLPISPAVRFYSIIGNHTPQLPLAQSSDGIVPYASAHLPGAVSEKVIDSPHSVQENPQAILEIRRILKAQLASD